MHRIMGKQYSWFCRSVRVRASCGTVWAMDRPLFRLRPAVEVQGRTAIILMVSGKIEGNTSAMPRAGLEMSSSGCRAVQ